jgi:rod shape determining protein RodA
MLNLRLLKLSDPGLWFSAGILVFIGFLAIFSATWSQQVKLGGDPFLFVKKQLLSLLVAGFGLLLFAYLDYRHWKRLSVFFYFLTLVLLVAVLFFGGRGQGAQRWLQFGFFSFQPSEISKFTILVALAAFLSERKKIKSFWEIGGLLLLVGVPFLLVFKQPDLGTALVFYVMLLGVLFASESSTRLLIVLVSPLISLFLRPFFLVWFLYILLLIILLFLYRASFWDWLLILGLNLVAGIALPFIWGALKTYQRQRILAFLNPETDPYGAGYHSLQSKIAIGSGGIIGKGFLHGTQTQLQFIPEQHSDFIFSVIGEEFGLLGAFLVLGIFMIYFWRILLIAGQAREEFGRLLALGIFFMTLFHFFANIGMALGLLPVVGIPLPFVSFGGSSLFLHFISLGTLQSIAMRRQKIIF